MIKEFRVQSKIHNGDLSVNCRIKNWGVEILSIKDNSGKGPVFPMVSDELIEEVKTLLLPQLPKK